MDFHSKIYQKRTKEWDDSFIVRLKAFGPIGRLVDYGTGNGALGVHLYLKHGLTSYVGIDISNRSLEYAGKHLTKYHVPHELKLLDTTGTFAELHADTFVSQAVIQHFPDQKYLDAFLARVNCSLAKRVMLQYRVNDKESTVFSHKEYTTARNVVRQCYTSSQYVKSHLGNYNLRWVSKQHSRNGYQYCILTLKKQLGKVLFYGPGLKNRSDLSRYGVVIITNHMGTLFPWDRIGENTKVWHLVNRLYTVTHLKDIKASKADKFFAIDLPEVRKTLSAVRKPVLYLPNTIKGVKGIPLGLTRMLNYVNVQCRLEAFTAVGVDFYSGGYVKGYKIRELTPDINKTDKNKHDVKANMKFVRDICKRRPCVHIPCM